ncbi:MAG: LysR family transcriptional regulator [Rhizobacter sp.]|nr:LysR family transcriptional regulator [Rhizobacter sp.]
MTPGLDHLVRRLRLRHFELLIKLAEAGTMRAAADQLSLTQPAISKMLVEIEAAFGTRLFERSRQGMRVNAFGVAAMHHARVIFGELSRAADELDAMRTGASAVLRVGTPSVTAIVPAAIVELHSRMPRASVQIREGRAHELVQRLLDGELDCVFGAITPEALASGTPQMLESEVVIGDELCVLASVDHALARRRRSTWGDFQSARWVAPPPQTLVRQAYMTAFLNEGMEPPVPVIETLSSVTIGTVLRLDPSLLAAVRFEHARDEIARGGVRRVVVTPEVPLPPLCLFTRRGELEQPVVLREFARALRHSADTAVPAQRPRGRSRPGEGS